MKQKKNVYHIISALFLGLMFTVFLFSFRADGYQSIGHTRFHVLLVLCSLYFLAVPVIAAESRITGTPLPLPEDTPKALSFPEAALLAFGLCTLISTLLSQYRAIAFWGGERHDGALTTFFYIGIFFFLSRFSKPEKWMLYLFAGAVTAFCALCVVQLMGFNPFLLYPEGTNYYDAEVAYRGQYLGSMGNIDFTAGFLCVAAVALFLGVFLLRDKLRFLLLVPALASLFVLYKTDVLAAYAALCGVAVAAPLAYCKKHRKKILLALAVLAAAGIACLLLLKMPEGSLPYEIQQLLKGNISESSGSGRIYIWREVLQRVPSHLFFGTGPETLFYADIPPFTRTDTALGVELVAYIDAAHNEYLHILYHQGIFALAAYLALLGSLFFSWFRYSHRDKSLFLLGAAALAYCIQAFFSISQPLVTPFFWIALGLMDRQIKLAKNDMIHIIS